MPDAKANGAPARTGTLGTFAGVFTPSILTILGIILFLRLGYVVGEGGLGVTLAIIAIATAISVLTSISLSAVATNIRVKGGGDYYLISRTLGVEFGGALGAVLFLAQAVSIAFYCIGFAEALVTIVPGLPPASTPWVAAGAVAFLFIFAWLGADFATRFQFVVMAALVAALAAFFVGGLRGIEPGVLAENVRPPAEGLPFWTIFAIFFPAVTGFTQGVSMSGDLKDPGRSLPMGTFLAVGVSTVVYVGAAILFASVLPLAELSVDYNAMRRVSAVPWLIDAGVIAATLSSAMASFLGAPRILQALAKDRVFAFLTPFAKGSGSSDNPRRAVLLAAGIALATIAAGDLNLVAAVVSMFFLISYGLLNYATYFEAWANSPSFRPRFRWFNKHLCLAGALLCLGAMLAISPIAGAAAGAVLFGLYQHLKRTAGPARWADSGRAYRFQRIREHLRAMGEDPPHDRHWRPVVLAFSDAARRRAPLLKFAMWIEGDSGLVTAVRIVVGSGASARRRRQEAEEELKAQLREGEFDAFPLIVSGPDLYDAAATLIQSHGLGPIHINTILLNWLEQSPWTGDEERREREYGAYLRMAFRLGRNVIALEADDDEWTRLIASPREGRRIDVWWRADASSRLMLLLAHLMTRTEDWEEASIRVFAPVEAASTHERTLAEITKTLEDVRIDATPELVAHFSAEEITRRSAQASIVFLPLGLKGNQPMCPVGGSVEDLVRRLPVCALVLAAQDIELSAEPDEGAQAEAAAASDAAADAVKKAEAAERDAEKAVQKATDTAGKLEKLQAAGGASPEKLKEFHDDAEAAKAEATEARRRAAKARSKADELARAVKKDNGAPASAKPEAKA